MGIGQVALAGAVTAVLAASAVAVGAAPGAPGQGSCEQPYQPWYSASTYPAPPDLPDLGTRLTVDAREPDTDGDGTADTIISGDYVGVAVQRGDGEVKLRPGDEHDYIYLSGYGPQPGDLDGDGRDELIIGVDQQGEQYLLPGTTAPGVHQIADVGIRLDGFSNVSALAGDQDGDGGMDLAFPYLESVGGQGWRVYSGADLMASGPGAAVAPPTPLGTYPGSDFAAAALEPGAVPTILSGARVGGLDEIQVAVRSIPEVLLRASGVLTEYSGGIGGIGVYERNGQILVTVVASDRGGSWLTVWNLSNPCSRYAPGDPTPPSTPPTAPPAAAVEGQAGYTG